jgi:hypothetical protein
MQGLPRDQISKKLAPLKRELSRSRRLRKAILHLIDAGLGADLVFFAAWRTTHAKPADDIVPDLRS